MIAFRVYWTQAADSPISSTYFQYGNNIINKNASSDYRLSVSPYPDIIYDPVYLEISVPYDNVSTLFSICRVELLSVGSNLPCVSQSKVNASVTYYSTYVGLHCLLCHIASPPVHLSICLSPCFCLCVSHTSSVFTAQCTLVHMRGLGIACRPSVCLSVCL